MKTGQSLLLSSGSPRRAELLTQMGIAYQRVITDVDESRNAGETPQDYVCRLAVEKAQAGLQMKPGAGPSLGADTVVLLKDEILGKPADREQAKAMLRALSGTVHTVLSAVALAQAGKTADLRLNSTRVWFAAMPDAFIERYCASDEPLDKAGAYAIQGETALYIERIEGSYSGVMGLPVFETGELLRAAGIAC